MYRLTINIPNPPFLLRRTFDFATEAEADTVQRFAIDQGLEADLHRPSVDAVPHAIRQITEELKLAADHRVA